MKSLNRIFDSLRLPAAERMTVGEFFEQHYVPARLAASPARTLKMYRRALGVFQDYLGRESRLGDFTNDNIKSFAVYLRARYSEHKACRCIYIVYAVWRFAHATGLRRHLPSRNLPPRLGFDTRPAAPRHLTPQQAEARWQAIQQHAPPVLIELSPTALEVPGPLWWSALFLVCRDSGRSVAEVVRLKFRDVDLDNATGTFPGNPKKSLQPEPFALSADTVGTLGNLAACYRFRHGGARLLRWADSVPNLRATLADLMLHAGIKKTQHLLFPRS